MLAGQVHIPGSAVHTPMAGFDLDTVPVYAADSALKVLSANRGSPKSDKPDKCDFQRRTSTYVTRLLKSTRCHDRMEGMLSCQSLNPHQIGRSSLFEQNRARDVLDL